MLLYCNYKHLFPDECSIITCEKENSPKGRKVKREHTLRAPTTTAASHFPEPFGSRD